MLNLPFQSSLHCVCEHCLSGKMKKLPFPNSVSTYLYPLELVHSDVWGLVPQISSNGFKYYVSFIDDMSKYTWFFPITSKSDV